MTTTIIPHPRVNDEGLDAFETYREAYTFGGCGVFALGMHAVTGWPMVSLDTEQDEWTHMGVRAPDGTLWDARGPHTSLETFIRPFTTVMPEGGLREVPHEMFFAAFTNAMSWSTKTIERLIAEMFPDLPHAPTSDRSRNLAFANELEALSKSTEVWVAPSSLGTVNQWPVIGAEFDGIAGYRAASKEGVVTFDRMLASEVTRGPTHIPRRVEQFLRDLEALSRKHRLWIRAGTPMTWPRLCGLDVGVRNQGHYVLRQTDNFAGFLLGLG